MQGAGRGKNKEYAEKWQETCWEDALAKVEELTTFKIGCKRKLAWGGHVFNYKCECGDVVARLKSVEIEDTVCFEESGAHKTTCVAVTGEVEVNQANFRGLSHVQKKLCRELYTAGYTTVGKMLARIRHLIKDGEVLKHELPIASKLDTFFTILRKEALDVEKIDANLSAFVQYAEENGVENNAGATDSDAVYVFGFQYDMDKGENAQFRIIFSTWRYVRVTMVAYIRVHTYRYTHTCTHIRGYN